MAKVMNDEQRLTALEEYKPQEHLIDIRDRSGNVKKYLPAAWRLYELQLRYPNANFSSDIVYMDHEKDFVIVRARLYLGTDYNASEKRAEAHKQGRLSGLDKVETAAMARAARNWGIGTEYALDMSPDDETEATHPEASQSRQNGHSTVQTVPQPNGTQVPRTVAHDRLKAIYTRGKNAGLYANEEDFKGFIQHALGLAEPVELRALTEDRAKDVEEKIADRERQQIGTLTDQQLTSIRKLCEFLGKPEPENLVSMKYIVAKKLIQDLTAEYREMKEQKQAS